MKLFDSELKVMDVLWRLGDRTAKEISSILGEETGWNVNTTYTEKKKCVAKGAVRRSQPNFLCHALVTKEEIQKAETEELIGRLFDGSPDLLFASLLSSQTLSPEQIAAIGRLEASGRMDALPDKLREAARLRMEYPELNLGQLGGLCEPAVSKSAFNHRMRKLLELAEGSAEQARTWEE